MSALRVVLLRHGRTEWNARSRMQGRLDPDLDDTGVAQAAAAAAAMTAFAPTLLVASDQLRAWQTAEAVGKATRLHPRPDERLRETSLGEWEGLDGDEVEAGWPGGLEAWRYDPTFAPPGGESRVDVATRASPVIDEVTDELAPLGDEATAVLVAHGGTIIALTASALGWPVDIWPTLQPLRNCAWSVLERRRAEWRLRAWGVSAG